MESGKEWGRTGRVVSEGWESTRSCSFRSVRVPSPEQLPRSVNMGRALLREGLTKKSKSGALGTWESRSTVRDIGLKNVLPVHR